MSGPVGAEPCRERAVPGGRDSVQRAAVANNLATDVTNGQGQAGNEDWYACVVLQERRRMRLGAHRGNPITCVLSTAV